MIIERLAPVRENEIPSEVLRLDYRGELDNTADWALVELGKRTDTWVVFVHGHGSQGDQLYCRADIRELWLPCFRRHGVGILSANLRGNAWMGPTAVFDLHELVEYVRQEYGGRSFFFCSGSMGGTSNLIYAILHPEDVAGVVALGAVCDLADYHRWCCSVGAGLPVLQEIAEAIETNYGGAPTMVPEAYTKHCVLDHTGQLTMPVRLVHGECDEIMPVVQSRALAERMADHEEFSYCEISGGDHDAPLAEIAVLDSLLA